MNRVFKIILSMGMSLSVLINGANTMKFLEGLLDLACPYYKGVTEEENFLQIVLGFNPKAAEGWLTAAIPWTAGEAAEEAESGEAEDKKPTSASTQPKEEESKAERFAGYPEDRYVTVSNRKNPEDVRYIKDQYPENYIHNFDSTKWLYVYGSSVLKVDPSYIDGEKFMEEDLSADLSGEEPKILIFHTHGNEGYVGMEKCGVIEVGNYLTEILSEKYGISVIHHTALYDNEGTNGAYLRMGEGVEKILEEHPSIQVMIDMHRDGVDDDIHLTQNIDGTDVAQIMLVNGVCQQLNEQGDLEPIDYLYNPYLEENLALSFRLKMASDVLYPGYMRHLYLARWQYSTYMRPLSMLLEVGAQTNTIEEAKAAMEPFAEVLYTVLTGNG